MNGDPAGDAPFLELEGPLKDRCVGVLVEAFEPDELDARLRLLDLRLRDVAPNAGYRTQVVHLVEHAVSHGLLFAVLRVTHEERRNHPRLRAVVADIFEANRVQLPSWFYKDVPGEELRYQEQLWRERYRPLQRGLEEILDELRIEGTDRTSLFQAAFPRQMRMEPWFERVKERLTVEDLLKYPLEGDFARFGYPAVALASLLVEQYGHPGLNPWMEKAKRELTLDFDEGELLSEVVEPALAWLREPELDEILYLQVPVVVDARKDGKPTMVALTMYWSDAQGKTTEPIFCHETELAEVIYRELDDNWEKILNREVVVELFLPFELVGVNLGTLHMTSAELEELGVRECIVLRRFLERTKEASSKDTRANRSRRRALQRWKQRWQYFNRRQRKIRDCQEWIKEDYLANLQSLPERILRQNRHCCTTSTEKCPGDKLSAMMEKHMEMGIPVVIWTNRPDVEVRPTFEAQVDDATTRELLTLVRRMQKAGEESCIAGLSIVYDDPERLLPRRE